MTCNYYLDDKRLSTRRGRLFQLLADGEWHTAKDLARVGGISFHTSLNRFWAAAASTGRLSPRWPQKPVGRRNRRAQKPSYEADLHPQTAPIRARTAVSEIGAAENKTSG